MHSCIPHEKLQQSYTNMQIFTSTQTSLHAHIEQKTLYNTNSRAHTRLLSFFCPCACASVWTTHISKLPNPSDLFKMPVFHRVLSTGFPRSVLKMASGRARQTSKVFRHQHLRMKHLFNYLNETRRVIIVHWAGAVKNRPFCHRAYKSLEFVWACQLKCTSYTWLTFFHRGGYILSNAKKMFVHQSCVN